MHLHHALSIVAAGLIGQTSAVYNTSSELPLNGWHACSAYTFAGEGQEEYRAQCLTVGVPLCYTDVCKLLPNVYPTINVFVKMLPATGAYADHATNVWMFASGASSEAEASMVTLHKRLNGSVNVLTMDLRGTGRSSRLDCVSSQAMTSGSPVWRRHRSHGSGCLCSGTAEQVWRSRFVLGHKRSYGCCHAPPHARKWRE
uniref:Uncharacterized protein n=1 Tax=Peronospora matthiolae TaxID=2874970 RepID=A0AAV1TPB8_9STRA